MLSELIDVTLDMAETCAPCSGENPGPATGPGAAGSAGSCSPGPNDRQNNDWPDRRDDNNRDDNNRDDNNRDDNNRDDNNRDDNNRDNNNDESDSDFERRLRRRNEIETVTELAWEYFTPSSKGLGKTLGTLGTVITGSEVLAEGVSNVQDAEATRQDRIYRDSEGAMGEPLPESAVDEGDVGSTPSEVPSDRSDSSRGNDADSPGQEEADRVMDDIRFREQMRQAGNEGWDGWKDWK